MQHRRRSRTFRPTIAAKAAQPRASLNVNEHVLGLEQVLYGLCSVLYSIGITGCGSDLKRVCGLLPINILRAYAGKVALYELCGLADGRERMSVSFNVFRHQRCRQLDLAGENFLIGHVLGSPSAGRGSLACFDWRIGPNAASRRSRRGAKLASWRRNEALRARLRPHRAR